MSFAPTVEQKMARDRLAICRKCPHFNRTGLRPTCGTPIIGEKVKYRGKEFRTCGCFLDLKVKFANAACPLGKWGKRKEEDKLMRAARELMAELTPGRITVAQVRKLNEIYPALVGRRQRVKECPDCVRAALSELEKYLEHRPVEE